MKELRSKMKEARKFLKYGEIKLKASLHNIDPERAWLIARGRTSPYENELPFCEDIFQTVKPRIELSKTI